MALSPYVAEMRDLIGTRELLIPTVTVLVADDDGRYLLGRRADVGDWVTIGGMVEPGESPATAARREAAEEIGCEVELGPVLGAYGGDAYRLTYPNGHRVACIGTVYSARPLGHPRPDGEELDRLEWFSVDQLSSVPLNSFNRSLLVEMGLTEPSSPTVRAAIEADVSIIEAIVIGAYHPHAEVMDTPPAPMLADYQALVAQGRVWLATTGASPVGLIVMWPDSDGADGAADHLYVDSVAVEPASQGAGIGRLLLDHADDRARGLGLGEVRCRPDGLTDFPR